MSKIGPKGLRKPGSRRVTVRLLKDFVYIIWPPFLPNTPAQINLNFIQSGQNCNSHACARIKRLIITPRRGVIPPLRGGKGAGKPKADRAIRKENKLPLRYAIIRMGLLAPSDRDRRSR